MRFRLFALFSLLALSLAVFTACGGDDDDSTNTATSAATKAATTASGTSSTDSGPATATKASGTAAAPTTASGSGSVTGSGADALKKLAQDLSGKTYQVTYDFNSVSGEDTTTGTMTIAQKPPQSVTKFEFNGESTLVISDGKASIFCTSADEQGTCYKSSDPESVSAGAFDLQDTLNNLDEDVNVTQVDNQKIAGHDAKCFDVKGSQEDGVACFDAGNGLLLLLESKSGDEFSIKATDEKTSVDSSLFDAPFPVQDLPSSD
jgi:outer membrane lipoprotein-sorting protein